MSVSFDPLRRARGEVPDQPPLRPFVIEGPRVVVCVVSPLITRVHVHYDGIRTGPCTLGDGNGVCEGHAKRWPVKVQDWLTIIDPAASVPCPQLMCLTPAATDRACPYSLWDFDGMLAPRMLWVWRQPCRRDGPIWCRLVPNDHSDYEPLYGVSTIPDTMETLRRMWAGRLKPRAVPRDGRPAQEAPE